MSLKLACEQTPDSGARRWCPMKDSACSRPAMTPACSARSLQELTLVASVRSSLAWASAAVFSSSPSVRSALPFSASLHHVHYRCSHAVTLSSLGALVLDNSNLIYMCDQNCFMGVCMLGTSQQNSVASECALCVISPWKFMTCKLLSLLHTHHIGAPECAESNTRERTQHQQRFLELCNIGRQERSNTDSRNCKWLPSARQPQLFCKRRCQGCLGCAPLRAKHLARLLLEHAERVLQAARNLPARRSEEAIVYFSFCQACWPHWRLQPWWSMHESQSLHKRAVDVHHTATGSRLLAMTE